MDKVSEMAMKLSQEITRSTGKILPLGDCACILQSIGAITTFELAQFFIDWNKSGRETK